MDEPLADPAAIALYFVCKLAAEQVKVVLSGEGADEIFGGYNVYSEPNATAYDKLPRGLRRGIGKVAAKLPAKRGVNFFVRKGKDLEERFIGNAYMFTPAERKALLNIQTDAPDPQEITKPFYDKRARMRSGNANAVSRPAPLDDRRYPAEGRQNEHGAFAGAARAVPR